MVAVFVDRDGVICVNRADYVRSVADLQLLPNAIDGLARLSNAGHRVFVVTNQAAVGRGQLSPVEAWSINERVVETVAEAGGRIEGVLMCSHKPEDACACRKPRPGLLHLARDEFAVDLNTAYLIGDHWSDIAAGAAAGCTPILVLSGRWREASNGVEVAPSHVVPDLARAVDLLLRLEAPHGTATAFPASSAPAHSREPNVARLHKLAR